jgi:hypothetical protein
VCYFVHNECVGAEEVSDDGDADRDPVCGPEIGLVVAPEIYGLCCVDPSVD